MVDLVTGITEEARAGIGRGLGYPVNNQDVFVQNAVGDFEKPFILYAMDSQQAFLGEGIVRGSHLYRVWIPVRGVWTFISGTGLDVSRWGWNGFFILSIDRTPIINVINIRQSLFRITLMFKIIYGVILYNRVLKVMKSENLYF